MNRSDSRNLILLGAGKLAFAVAEQAMSCSNSTMQCYRTIYGTTRFEEHIPLLQAKSIEPILLSNLLQDLDHLAALSCNADVLVSFPPDHYLESLLASVCGDAHRIVYISSTGVYGSQCGVIDDSAPVSPDSSLAKVRLESERIWRTVGAIVLRSPAIYGKDRGLHLSLLQGTYKPPANEHNFVSRIHQTDFARLILLGFETIDKSETFVVGDLEPARHKDVVNWLRLQLGLDLDTALVSPGSEGADRTSVNRANTEGKSVHRLRGDRQIDARMILELLGYSLLFPSYKQGYSDILAG